MPKLSLAKLERHLYSAADRLRQEGLDAATYKDYIFGMLFLKRVPARDDAVTVKKTLTLLCTPRTYSRSGSWKRVQLSQNTR